MRKIRQAIAVAAGGAALLSLGIVPAHAENSRTSYIGGWARGNESSRWYDNNNDGVSTSVGFSGCQTDSSFSNASLTLYKDVSLAPDENHGGRTNYCNTSYWGDESEGSYYFTLSGFTGGSRLSVSTVRIAW
ncbi:hypothetical protein ABT071_38330 [Streptomyces sp. NPDC002506]|uniref:hypothetical protein n=1 Tax=Streptomyces sp. NPDC002506 TaxID=3154536 RepID=UPI003318D663